VKAGVAGHKAGEDGDGEAGAGLPLVVAAAAAGVGAGQGVDESMTAGRVSATC
jgi:hypothetical protein